MKTYLECIPCFFQQALRAAELAGATSSQKREIINQIAKIIPTFSLNSSPPQMGKIIYSIVRSVTKKHDPYKKIKERSNQTVEKIYPLLKKKILSARDHLLMAVKLAVAGNIIDYGACTFYDIKREIKDILRMEEHTIRKRKGARFDYKMFRRCVSEARNILYLADNSGETFFDALLIEEIKRNNPFCSITYAVKSCPIINDALPEDAYRAGIDKWARVIPNGSDAPGTVLSLCSPSFREIFRKAKVIISKGQGNFESLSAERRAIFFLFMVKCSVVSADIGLPERSIVLYYKNK